METINENLVNTEFEAIDSDENNSVNEQIVERRQCWLCLGYEESGEDLNSQWISPCRCSGTAKWIHNECLQLWIDEKQKLDSSVTVKCSQCNTKYVLIFPPNAKFIDLIIAYESMVNKVSTYGMILSVSGAIYMSAFSYGLITCMQVIGTERTLEMIENSSSAAVFLGLPSIPMLLCSGKLFDWESIILRFWRRYYKSIPLLSYLTGSPSESNIRESIERNLLGRDNAIEIQRNDGVINHIEISVSGTSICRAFCGALLLPTVSKIFGHYLYENIESDLHKTLLGGLTFILIKGSVKIYLRQQQFIRQSKRQILNYDEIVDKLLNDE